MDKKIEELNSRQKQALDTKWHIFNVAMSIFQKKRFDEVTVNEICRAAGVSTGAFYHHYPSKEHLLLEEYNLVNKLVWSSTDILMETDPIERLIEYVGMYAESAEDATLEIVTEVYRVWLTLRTGFPLSFEDGVLSGMLGLVEEAQMSSKLDPELDSKQFALDILTITRGTIYHWCQMNGSFSVKEKAVQMVRPFIEYHLVSK